MHKVGQIISALLLCSLAPLLGAEEVLPVQLEKIDALQRRADKLAFGSTGANNYHLAKARTWLDLATSEYHQTDTSGILPAAVAQADTLLTALENGQTITSDMPTDLPGVEKVRNDLWTRIASIKKGDYSCGQRQLAEGEVQLIWAGHEKVESGWSHAESYAATAEDSLNTAQSAIAQCNGHAPAQANDPQPAPIAVSQPAPQPAPAITSPPPAPARVLEKTTLSADALFNFDSFKLTRHARAKLRKLVRDIRHAKSLEEIVLVGHSDRLRTDKKFERNQTLSERRAYRIKQYLVSKGIPADKIRVSGVGPEQPLVTCPDNVSKAKQVICLKPNRRVDITLRGL